MSSIKRTADTAEEKNRIEGGTLYLVATPIGNLADLSGSSCLCRSLPSAA